MARRLTIQDKVRRAIDPSLRQRSARALLQVLEELIADEMREIYANEEQDGMTQDTLIAKAKDTYQIDTEALKKLTYDAHNARRERLASKADPEAVATMHDATDLADSLAHAIRAIVGGASCV